MGGSRDNIPGHECSQEHRIQKLEAKAEAHESRLSAGDVGFAEVRKDLAQIQTTLTKIEVALAAPKVEPSRLDKFWDACITWFAAVIMLGGLWVIAKSGQIPGVHP